MLVPVDHRRNLSHVFLFRQNSPKEVKKIYDEFAGVFNKFADFKKALDICTHSYGCMVIGPCPNFITDVLRCYEPLDRY